MKGKQIITTTDAPQPIGPYNQALQINGTLYVSGQIAIDPKENAVIRGNIEKETRQVMENLGAILKEAGMSFDNVVRCSIYTTDLDNFSRINKVYGSYFGEAAPTRETVEVNGLPKNARVEISLIATE